MSDIAIRADGLAKQYRLGVSRRRYKTLRDSIADLVRWPVRAAQSMARNGRPSGPRNKFWALKDVSFEIQRGEVVGVIGGNGAGKSTLLKILSRITEPTLGRVEIRGRIGSLLEVGTGFHPELTGRENIYLNGAILGMKKNEIDRRFDEIVAFAEVETFLDTMVKHYSSGMYLRLAFAVAAHLEPEILLVDEVLAVGDAAFQRKCLGRMSDVARQGRTVLFVSHNLAAVESLCGRAMMLCDGDLASFGDARYVLGLYRERFSMARSSLEPGCLFQCEPGQDESFRITRLELFDQYDDPKPSLATWDHVKFRIHYHAPAAVVRASCDFRVTSLDGTVLLFCATQPDNAVPMSIQPGDGHCDCIFPQWPLAAGSYLIAAALAMPTMEHLTPLVDMAVLDVQVRPVFGEGTRAPDSSRTLVVAPHQWVV